MALIQVCSFYFFYCFLNELPTYLVLATGTKSDVDVLKWWPRHADEIPTFAKIARKFLLISTSSAECERVFSLLKAYTNKRENASTQETLEAKIMLRYNSK